MAQWRLWLANRAKGASYTATVNDEDASYPFSNALDEDRLTVFKPTDTSDTVMRIDLGAAYSISGFSFMYHTLSASSAIITLKYSTTDNSADAWGDLNTAYSKENYAYDHVGAITEQTKRYWWVGVTDQGAVATIGEIGLWDLYYTMTRNPHYPIGRNHDYHLTKTETLGGYPRITQLGTRRRSWDLTFAYITAAQLGYIVDSCFNTYAPGRPFLITDEYWDSGGTDAVGAYMVVLDGSSVKTRRIVRDLHEVSFTLQEI